MFFRVCFSHCLSNNLLLECVSLNSSYLIDELCLLCTPLLFLFTSRIEWIFDINAIIS